MLSIYKAAKKLSQLCNICVRLNTHVCVQFHLQQVDVHLQQMDVRLHTQVAVRLQQVEEKEEKEEMFRQFSSWPGTQRETWLRC